MTEIETKLQTESQSINENSKNNKPWYKKKNTIIVSSSILGVGTLATVIAVPIALTTNASTSASIRTEVVNAINALNKDPDNSSIRVSIWNTYASLMNRISQGQTETPYSKIIYTPSFINQFIDLLTNNLYIAAVGPGAIIQADATLLKNTLTNTTNKPLFENNANAIYTNLFTFDSGNTSMFRFMDNTTLANSKIVFELFMPMNGLDLIYNANQTVSLKTKDIHSNTAIDNVRLVITKFDSPSIISATSVYFKPNTIIELPSTIMGEFPNFFDDLVTKEISFRTLKEQNYNNLKTNLDKSTMNGLSYWNSFSLNFAVSNTAFLNNDFLKQGDSAFVKFLSDNAPSLPSNDLTELSSILAKPTTNGLTKTPFVQSPTYSNLLFKTTEPASNNYSFELKISAFTYEFAITNLFEGPNAIKITPKLTFEGIITKIPLVGDAIPYTIANASYDVNQIINISADTSMLTGGFEGFLDTLIDIPADPLTTLTNGLVAFNNKTDDEKIAAWNAFNTDITNSPLILAELIKPDVLYNFVIQNIDLANVFGMGGSFPTIVDSTFKASFNKAAALLKLADLSFKNPGVVGITLPSVIWGATPTTDLFTSITIYFGYEANSITNINLTSSLAFSNLSLSQTEGDSIIANLDSLDKIKAAAAKKFSIVFETSASINHIAYFGQLSVGTSQITKPIIIPQTILTSESKFIEFIQAQK